MNVLYWEATIGLSEGIAVSYKDFMRQSVRKPWPVDISLGISLSFFYYFD
jgi:hypothetical protein